jgi:predicted membrane protein
MEVLDNDYNKGNGNQANNETGNKQSVNNNYPMNTGSSNNKIVGGFIVVVIGLVFLLKQMGFYLPHWLFSWEMILIAIGLFIGFKSDFQNISWIILVLIGGIFLVGDLLPDLNMGRYLWPISIIIVGLYIMVKPRTNYTKNLNEWDKYQASMGNQSTGASYQSSATSDFVEASAVFGSVKKIVISKDFKGGELNAVFGSAELNLAQADITHIVELEVNAVFGGTRLIVPSHWEIKSELTAVLGGIEDKRHIIRNAEAGSNKFLVLKGNAVFGGIEILSFN